MTADRRALLARSWDEAADHYLRYFVPRFEPWVTDAVSAITAPLPDGAILVPCCGTFPELPALAEAHPGRQIVGIDLSPGMVMRARMRASVYANVEVLCDDATNLARRWPAAAAIVSVFGLQQLPDPATAIVDWTRALADGGRLSVIYWPPVTEATGPFALLDDVLTQLEPATAPEDEWPDLLPEAIRTAGGVVERDTTVSHPMNHPDAATFWNAMMQGGPLHTLVVRRGAEYVDALRPQFLARSPPGPWQHRPNARWLVAQRVQPHPIGLRHGLSPPGRSQESK